MKVHELLEKALVPVDGDLDNLRDVLQSARDAIREAVVQSSHVEYNSSLSDKKKKALGELQKLLVEAKKVLEKTYQYQNILSKKE